MGQPIRIAIVGGSIAGCTLANGLMKHPNLIFDVYDAKAAFGERGVAIDLAINAQNALEAMGLNALQMFRNTGTVQGEEEPYSAMGENRGKRLYQTPPGIRRNVMRTRWLAELIKDLPPERLHSNKTLTSITEPKQGSTIGPYLLHFSDGSTHEADAIVGCDGIRSKVREIILGSNDVEPKFSGYWDTRATTTPEKAAEFMGRELFDPTRRQSVAMTGKGSFMLFSPSNDGTSLGVIMSAPVRDDFDRKASKIPLTKEFLENHFESWDPKFRDGVIKCLIEDPKGPGVVWSQWESARAPTYFRNAICMMGDAAHAICPYMGQGANMAMEDAAVMSAVLGEVCSTSELPAAFKAFDATRRGRPEQVGAYSHKMARLATGQISMDPDVVAASDFKTWWEYAYRGINMREHLEDAKKEFASFKQLLPN